MTVIKLYCAKRLYFRKYEHLKFLNKKYSFIIINSLHNSALHINPNLVKQIRFSLFLKIAQLLDKLTENLPSGKLHQTTKSAAAIFS